MKTVLMWLLIFVVLFVVCLIVGLIGCLYDGSLAWRDGWFRAIDANGQVIKPKPYTKPTEEEVQQMRAEHQEYRSTKAAGLCFAALGAFILGWLTSKALFHTVGVCLLVGAFAWDYKTATAALFMWHFIIPALILMLIVGLFKRS